MKDIEFALNDGTVTWEGLARNVEYLDIRDDMRRFLGRWYVRRRSQLREQSDSSESSDSEEDEIFSPVGDRIVDPDTDADGEDERESDEADEKCVTKKISAVKRLSVGNGIEVPRFLAKSQSLRVSIP